MASLAAMAVQPLVLVVRCAPLILSPSQPLDGLGFFIAVAGVVAAAVVLVLGVPAFLVLRNLQRESWTFLSLTGIVLGAAPAALSRPRHLTGYTGGSTWHGTYVETYVDGIPTTYAWLSCGEHVLFFGLHGLVGSLVFYAVWRRLALVMQGDTRTGGLG